MSRAAYKRVHSRLERERGRAVGMPCVAPGCSRLADGWGLRGGEATHSGEDYFGRRVKWSKDLAAYSPMCVHHNRQVDMGGDWDSCPNGHYRITWGAHADGRCRGCARESSRRYHGAHRDDPAYRARRREQQSRRAAARTKGTAQ